MLAESVRRPAVAFSDLGRLGCTGPSVVRATVSVVVLHVLFMMAIPHVSSTFTGVSQNPGNSWSTGTVVLGDNDSGSGSVLTLADAAVGATSNGCVQVSYTGSVAATVRLYASATGSGLDSYLAMTITRGTVSSGAFPSCAGFTADTATYAAANGVMYSGTLAGFVSSYPSYASGLVDPTSAAPATWTTGTTRAYKIAVTVQSGGEAKNTTPTFWWEARDS